MMTVPIKAKHLWNTLQEPRCPSYFPAGYLLLLSALDNGWRIAAIELKPSWDQHGFIYLLTLRHASHSHSQHLVLPKNAQVEALLVDQALALVSQAAPLAV